MNWNKINNNTYECQTDFWHFIIKTNPNGDSILSTISHYKHLENDTKIILISKDVRQCFYRAFDLNLLSERREN